MERNWTKTGEGILPQATIVDLINSLEWHTLPYKAGFMPGYAIKEAIRQFNLKAVKSVAISGFGSLGFYAISNTFKNGNAVIYLVDMGDELICVCSDFYPNN